MTITNKPYSREYYNTHTTRIELYNMYREDKDKKIRDALAKYKETLNSNTTPKMVYYKKLADYKKELKSTIVTRKQFTEICFSYCKEISKHVILGREVKLPAGLGYIRIRKNKIKYTIVDDKIKVSKKIINWGDTRKLWKQLYPDKTKEELKLIKNKPRIFYKNEHSNNEIMRWYWDKCGVPLKNKSVYKFSTVKQNRLTLSKFIFEDPENCNLYRY